ncbi:MAG: Release factor glutamine methyltransferase [Chthoniobacteraceae bacterium]|nr:Release factor glutamine methyltransferase [Chthoniobacteraceae bacterium]
MKTVLEVIKATTAYFEKHEVESARLNIEYLLAHVLGKKRMELYMEFDRPLSDQELGPLRELVRRRSAGEPLQHILGTVEFLGRTFLCDKRALVPRPETEQLVELILTERRDFRRILDVGTGSGIIALSLAAELPEASVEAVDISEEALALCADNARRLGLIDRVALIKSNLLQNIEGEFDLIVANLPYIDSALIPTLSREVLFDPLNALDGGRDGLELLLILIDAARKHLHGWLALEIGHDQSDLLSDKLSGLGYTNIRATTDYQGRRRFLFANHG